MEAILKEINGVIGVTGSFVCLSDGSIAARALPDSFDAARVALAARVASQTFHALDTSGLRVAEADLTFGQARLLLKNLRNGVLVILCARNFNLPLLNLTANVAAKKLTEELKPVKVPAKEPAAAPPPAPEPAPAAPPAPLPTPEAIPAAPSAPAARVPGGISFADLESEWQQIISEAAKSKTTLRVMSSLATWLCCPKSRALLAPPENKQLDCAARSTQRESIRRVVEHWGYQTNQPLDEFYSSPRLYFANPARAVALTIHLDAFAMYHQLDLTPFLAQEGNTLSETALLLLRLQLVEMPEAGLRELNALLLDHDWSWRTEPGKIDVSQIARLCADQWGWYKTATINLQRVMAFAVRFIPSDDKAIVVERVEQIIKTIEDAPKSLRWKTRARLGETVRWYDIPPTTPPQEQRPVEIRYGD